MSLAKNSPLRSLMPTLHVVGMLSVLFSGAFLPPLLWSAFSHDGQVGNFAISAAITALVGGAAWVISRPYKREVRPREGFLVVAATWCALAGFATLPLLLGIPGLSFGDAYFETVSALTTTGATVLTGLDTLPPSINLWRHLLIWLGGLGIIGMAMAVLPLLGVGGMQLYRAESTGPIKDGRLTPRIAQTAKSLWLIYVGLTALCTLALHLGGMTWLDALCHAFTTLSLGGFSTHDASMAYFDSPLLEGILMAFMVLAAMNFATHFTAWRESSLRAYWRDVEVRWLLMVLAFSAGAIAALMWAQSVVDDPLTALRLAAFNLVSVATTCGLVNVDYGQWPVWAGLWILLLSCICCSAGSTGGGIKMVRTIILFKQSGREMRQLLHPSAVLTLKLGEATVAGRVVTAVLGFIHLYTMSVAVLTFLLLLSGMDFLSAFTAIIATINNAGPGLGLVGPAANYGVLDAYQTAVCTLSMLLGRLEIFVLIIPFTPAFWRE